MSELKITEPLTADNNENTQSSSFAPSRRQFLTGVAALGATALIPAVGSVAGWGALMGAQTGGAARKRPRRIDVHHHPSLPAAPAAANAPRTCSTGAAPAVWTP